MCGCETVIATSLPDHSASIISLPSVPDSDVCVRETVILTSLPDRSNSIISLPSVPDCDVCERDSDTDISP